MTRPTKSDRFFTPQGPYWVLGTLREQLTYPHDEDHSDEELIGALKSVGLGHLADREDGLNATENWADLLSVGEAQRVEFARLGLSKAKLFIIYEGTSALDAASEAHAMSTVEQAGRIMVSVGHRPSLLKFLDAPQIAAVIYNAATEVDDQFRIIAGKDAFQQLGLLKKMNDEQHLDLQLIGITLG